MRSWVGCCGGVLARDDDYAGAGKPVCDYDDRVARRELVDALAKDAMAALGFLDGRELTDLVAPAAKLLATLVGQDLDQDEAGVFRIARRVAKDRVISTVDPQARHGHKTAARGFDGYKGHLAIDPDTEIITATTVTAGNVGDAEPATDMLAGDLPTPAAKASDSAGEPENDVVHEDQGGPGPEVGTEPLAVYGDAAYGAGALLAVLERAGASVMVKVQPPVAPAGRFAKDRFVINAATATVTCPANVSVGLRATKSGGGLATFGGRCAKCPWRPDALPRSRDARSASPRMRPSSPGRAPPSATRPGARSTGPPGQRSNARSATSCAASTADDEHGSGA